MLENGPSCAFRMSWDTHCSGKLHQYMLKKVTELDGTPISGSREVKTYFCEGHYPDRDDPKFLLCTCELCKR